MIFSKKTAVKSDVGFNVGTGEVVAVNAVSAGIISSVGFSTDGVVAGRTAAGIQAEIESMATGPLLQDSNHSEPDEWELSAH